MTKLIRFAFVVAIAAAGSPLQAQELKVVEQESPAMVSVEEMPSLGNATPEMWFYMQELRRYEDPAAAQRRRAELKASARRSRMISREWYGISNLRPAANPVPFMYRYSAHQTTNGWDTVRDTYYQTSAAPSAGGPRQF